MCSDNKTAVLFAEELSNNVTTKRIGDTPVILSPACDILQEELNNFMLCPQYCSRPLAQIPTHFVDMS